MKVCPTCKSEHVQEYLAGWHDANSHERDLSAEPLALATLYPDQYWCLECGARQDELLEVSDPERPAWWNMPEDVALAMAKEMSQWYCGDAARPYTIKEVQEAWQTVRLRMCEPEDDNEPVQPYAKVFFYDVPSGCWTGGLDTADREWISDLIDAERKEVERVGAKALLATARCPVCDLEGSLYMTRALVETYTADGAREEDTHRTVFQCTANCPDVDGLITDDRRDDMTQAFAIHAEGGG